LKEPSSFEEILWLYLRGTDVKSVGIPKQLCDLLGMVWGILIVLLQRYVKMPSLLSMWKEKHIM
jgi:hypothetical protein